MSITLSWFNKTG